MAFNFLTVLISHLSGDEAKHGFNKRLDHFLSHLSGDEVIRELGLVDGDFLSHLSGDVSSSIFELGHSFWKCYLKHFPCAAKIGMQFFDAAHKSPERWWRLNWSMRFWRRISKSPERWWSLLEII